MDQRIQTVCLLVVTGVIAAAALYWLRPVMVPFVLALFITLGLNAVSRFGVTRVKLPRALALPATLLVAFLGFSGVVLLITTSVTELSGNAGVYSARLAELVQRTVEVLPVEIQENVAPPVLADLKQVPVSAVGNALVGVTNAIVDLLSNSFLVLIFVAFLLLGGSAKPRVEGSTWAEIENRVERYLLQKALLSGATGLLVGLILSVLGIELAMVFGLLAFLLNFIPSFGSIIATVLPLPVILLSPDISTTTVILAIALPASVQITLGNIIEPKLMGDTLELHPAMLLVALIFWGMLWGVIGMFLATPITAMLKILFEKLEPTRPVARIMAGDLAAWR